MPCEKVPEVPHSVDQSFLDNRQYSTTSIRQYERVYGVDFVSPGGAGFARECIAEMALPVGARVLDAGCGLGGSSFLMAKEFGLNVLGMDLSLNMLQIAGQKLAAHGLEDKVELAHGDVSEIDPRRPFDGVYSRDVFLHIHDKRRLFSSLFNALAPGGILLFTDYCCGEKPWPREFESYVADRNYALHTLDEYPAEIASAGFVDVESRDITARFIEILKQDLETIAMLRWEGDQQAALESSWNKKRIRADSGCHRWGLFIARRPAASAQSSSG